MEQETINSIVGELILKEKYKFLPDGAVGAIVRDAFNELEEREKGKR